jgi:hypothetical protein
MRVLLSCLQGPKRHALPAYEFWRPYFTKGCEEAGIDYVEVPDVDWAEGLLYSPGRELDQWRARTWEATLALVRQEHARNPLDFFLSYFYPQQIEVAAIKEIQQLGIPCVNFFCDNYREFSRVPEEYHSFALHWVPEYEALPMYRRAGLPHLHAPMPCWVPPLLRAAPQHETEPATFIGSVDILRRDLLGRALAAGADIQICGQGWVAGLDETIADKKANRLPKTLLNNQWVLVRERGVSALYYKMINHFRPLHSLAIEASRIHPTLSNEDYLRVTREACVTIGVNRVPTLRASNHHPLTYSRLRDIEAPMLGACYLTEWTDGLAQIYDLGTEVETYSTPEELVGKVEALKKDAMRRRGLRERGQKRALTEHSIARSLGRIQERLGLVPTR